MALNTFCSITIIPYSIGLWLSILSITIIPYSIELWRSILSIIIIPYSIGLWLSIYSVVLSEYHIVSGLVSQLVLLLWSLSQYYIYIMLLPQTVLRAVNPLTLLPFRSVTMFVPGDHAIFSGFVFYPNTCIKQPFLFSPYALMLCKDHRLA